MTIALKGLVKQTYKAWLMQVTHNILISSSHRTQQKQSTRMPQDIVISFFLALNFYLALKNIYMPLNSDWDYDMNVIWIQLIFKKITWYEFTAIFKNSVSSFLGMSKNNFSVVRNLINIFIIFAIQMLRCFSGNFRVFPRGIKGKNIEKSMVYLVT